MATHAQLAAKLLRDAAAFFRSIAKQNPSLATEMEDNATVYEGVADLLEKDPMANLEL